MDRSPGIAVSRVPGLGLLLATLRVLPDSRGEVAWPPNVRRWDVRRGLRYPSGSVHAIYTSHMLEHLSKSAADGLLAECRRVLRRDGLLRIAVPDLRASVLSYTDSSSPEAADEFMRATLLGVEREATGWGHLVQAVSGAKHRWMYDESSISLACRRAGFEAVEPFGFREGRCPDLDNVETRQDSLFVEAYDERPEHVEQPSTEVEAL